MGIGLYPYEIMLSIFARAADHNGGRQFPQPLFVESRRA